MTEKKFNLPESNWYVMTPMPQISEAGQAWSTFITSGLMYSEINTKLTK